MYVHFIACIWFYLIDRKKEWIPPLDYITGSFVPGPQSVHGFFLLRCHRMRVELW